MAPLPAPVASAPPPGQARTLLPLAVQGELPPPWGQAVLRLDGATMGTTWSVAVCAPQTLPLAPLQNAIRAVLDDVIAQMSTWDRGSLLCAFNALPAGRSMTLPDSFATVIDAALAVARRSGGAFDPTVGGSVGRWGFGPASLGAGRPGGHWAALRWEPGLRRLTQPGGVHLDLSAIAKGHAVDRVSQLLSDCGLPHHLVEIGGELRGEGFKPGAQPWWVDLELPSPQCPLPPTRVALHGLSAATSGDYRRQHATAEGPVSHTLDPRTGAPVRHALCSVTVLAPQAMWADAWATALMVLGPDDGLALATREDLPALLQSRPAPGQPDWQEALSPALLRLAE